MKITSIIGSLLLLSSVAFGQTILVSGTVNNQAGQPVAFAFIKDVKHNYATYSDSTGNFHLKADPSSSLVVLAPKYKNEVVAIGNNPRVKIILEITSGAVGDNGDVKVAEDGTKKFLMNRQLLSTYNGGNFSTTIKTGFDQEPTRGSRYLFDSWVPAFGVNKNDTLLADPGTLYNYDKLNGNLLLTTDQKSTSMIPKTEVKSFTLFDGKAHPHTFISAPEVNNKPFVEILVNSPKVKIYKKMETKLMPADFHTDGVIDVGHRYDEYVDASRYYVVKDGGKPQSFSLKKKAIKEAFGSDADKFLADQGSREVDDDYLRDLNDTLTN
jgi:hypothetical protein